MWSGRIVFPSLEARVPTPHLQSRSNLVGSLSSLVLVSFQSPFNLVLIVFQSPVNLLPISFCCRSNAVAVFLQPRSMYSQFRGRVFTFYYRCIGTFFTCFRPVHLSILGGFPLAVDTCGSIPQNLCGSIPPFLFTCSPFHPFWVPAGCGRVWFDSTEPVGTRNLCSTRSMGVRPPPPRPVLCLCVPLHLVQEVR